MKKSFTVEIDVPNMDENYPPVLIERIIKKGIEDEILCYLIGREKINFKVSVIPNTLETNELQSLPIAEDFSPPSEETHKENMQVLGLNT